jgi:hypothetical protein
MDPDPNPENLLRTLFIAKSRSREGDFLFLEDEAG